MPLTVQLNWLDFMPIGCQQSAVAGLMVSEAVGMPDLRGPLMCQIIICEPSS
jgi:hypothetical protein